MADIHDPIEQPARLSITQTSVNGARVLALAGELDADNADILRDALHLEPGFDELTVLDVEKITFLDSSAINVLVTARRNAEAAGGRLRMAALTDPVRRVVEIVGLDTIIACYPTLAEAVKP
ncbi:STAS domain-containing protein [Streptomyces sp. NPDC059944]|uniref:STAS domain-containing protein n=1 Tax=unclassified Streptomyces TaxID=2593676 RepID=UPI0036469A70